MSVLSMQVKLHEKQWFFFVNEYSATREFQEFKIDSSDSRAIKAIISGIQDKRIYCSMSKDELAKYVGGTVIINNGGGGSGGEHAANLQPVLSLSGKVIGYNHATRV